MLKTLGSLDYHREQIELLLNAKGGMFASNFLTPILTVIVLQDFVPMYILLILTFVQIILFIIRMVFAKRTLKIIYTIDKKSINSRLKFYLFMIAINSFLLGVVSIFSLLYADDIYTLFLLTMYVVISAGSLSTLGAVYHAVFIFTFVVLSIFIIALIVIGATPVYYLVAILILIYIFITMPSAFKIYRSISSNIEQKEDLKEKNSNFQNLLDITMEAIVLFDKEQNIIDINQSGVILFGLKDKSAVIGRSFMEFVPESSLPKLKEDHKVPFELHLKKSNGEIFPTLMGLTDLMIDGKKVRIGTILDLTQLKEKDQLIIQQSRQAAMGEMIGNIAHQWRQPLNALGLVLQNINFEYQVGTLDDKFMDKSVAKGNKLVKIMSKTIDDFRNFFKPNKIKECFLIANAINNTIGLIDSSFFNDDIEIKKDLDNTLKFRGYPSEFSQVILNILSNSKDALIANNIENKKVEIFLFQKDNNIFIEISDNAGGIHESIIEKIFEPYFTTKEEGKGTGIGLYMSKTIIETNMGGSLIVKNGDAGAVFTIILQRSIEDKLC